MSEVFLDPIRDALQATADGWFRWLLISSGLVAAGVALEAWEATITLKRWFCLRFGKKLAEPDERSWAIPASYVGLLLVIIGVLGESVFDGFVSKAETALRAHDSKTLAQAESDAADAKLHAAELESETASLEEHTLELGPRDLLLYGTREEVLMNGLRKLKGQEIQVRICVFGDSEVRNTAERLTTLFNLAEWNVAPNSPDWSESNCQTPPPDSYTKPTGLWIGIPSPIPDPITQDRMRTLFKLLNAVPLETTLHIVGPDTSRLGPSRTTIMGRYGAPSNIVIVVQPHSFEINKTVEFPSVPTIFPLGP